MAAAITEGVEGHENCAVTIKHFACNSIDGIHMWSDAYEIVFENMKKYILE